MAGRCVVHLIPHGQAADRPTWTGDDDLRPLDDAGRAQARAMAVEIGAVDAAYSSPARRCTETLAPMAVAIEVTTLDALRELAPGESFSDVAARMFGVLAMCSERHGGQVVAIASHGDAIPITIAALVGRHGLDPPARVDRGGWYALGFDGDDLVIEARGRLLSE